DRRGRLSYSRPVDIDIDVRAFVRSEIDPAVLLVDALQFGDFPLAFRHLSDQRAVGLVVIEVLIAVARAQPEERAVGEERRIVDRIDPRLRRLAENRPAPLAIEPDDVEIEPGLLAVLNLIREL